MGGMMRMAAMANASKDGAKASVTEGNGPFNLKLTGEPAVSAEDVAETIENTGEGEYVSVAYTHPQLGKTTYRGWLSEKYTGASNLQSYIQLSDCKRIGRSGALREREATKRLMTAFIDEVKIVSPSTDRSRSRSRSRSARRSRSRRRRSPDQS
mmetsp:Transcript_20621/g.47112  ORF Transcript_20621/g.47112 Transcript_20621/m.47112 type:complete len:154 (+) Transcript_20621:1-462(+)